MLTIAATLLLLTSTCAAEPAFQVDIDYATAPECEAFALKSKALCEEWYPKINEILFGADQPLPYDRISLKFEPMKGVAATSGAKIRISAEWVTKKAPNDYGMVIHELTHIVQNYRGKGDGWLTEGIADWVRDQHFEPGVRKQRIDPDKASYKNGYGTTGVFLAWLEKTYDKELVRKLNVASNKGTYRREMFEDLCGKDVEALWKEFTDTLRAPKATP